MRISRFFDNNKKFGLNGSFDYFNLKLSYNGNLGLFGWNNFKSKIFRFTKQMNFYINIK